MRVDDAPIAAPCDEDWERMRPEAGGRRRWCDRCERRVHDLSAMDEREARALLEASAGLDLCIAYTHDEDGEIVFEGPPPDIVPLTRLRPRPGPNEVAKLASAASLAAVLSACTPHDRGERVQVVSDPIDSGAQPMVVIPPSEPSTSEAGPEQATAPPADRLDEPCEPTPPTPTVKKGRRKRMGVPLKGTTESPL